MYKEFIELSEEQKKAIIWDKNDVLVSAGPGSGKTVVIINRVYFLIKYKRVNPKNIIILTFTKSAANNMKARFLEIYQTTNIPFFGTFHGLCYKILFSFYGKIDIIESNESYRVVKSFLTTYMEDVSDDRVKEYINGISVYKCCNFQIQNKDIAIDLDILKNCYNFYEDYKRERKLLDFDDLQIRCKELLLKNIKLLNYYRNIFKHILVDEFQDCDDIQLEILKMLKSNNYIFAVGDEDQCIYSFRGSNPTYMVDFIKEFKEGEIIYLSTNYRSRDNIVKLSMNCIKHNTLRTNKRIMANKVENGIINEAIVYNDTQQGELIASSIEKMINATDYKYSDYAVLYRTNMESRSIIDSLIKKNIPFKLLDKEYNFFSHFICKDLISYLKLSLFPYNVEDFIRIINKPYRYISKGNLEKLTYGGNGSKNLFMTLRNIEGIPIFQMKALEKLERNISGLNKISLCSAVDCILYDLGYNDYILQYGKKFGMSVEDLDNVVKEFRESVLDHKSIKEFLEHVEKVEEETKKSKNIIDENRVTLSTIHSVKGMEFKNVFIINLVDDNIPYEHNGKMNIEEERRLFYVGVTRAIDNITFLSPQFIRGNKKIKSMFLRECNIESVKLHTLGIKKGDLVVHRIYGSARIKEVDENNITLLFSNEVERKFDLSILLNNNLIEMV